MLGPFTTASRLTPIHRMSLVVLSRAACASMSTTTSTTTTTTRDRGDRYGPTEWAQLESEKCLDVDLVLGGQDVAGELGDPEPPVLVEQLAMGFDLLPRPHVAPSPHVLTHHEVIHEVPPATATRKW